MDTGEKTASRILKSTAIVGSSNIIATVIRILRMKVFAVCLGPTGVGLFGIYSSVMSTAASISEVGVGSSGVRQVAEANGDEHKISGTLYTLRWVTILLGVAGALTLALMGRVVSRWSLGSYEYAGAMVVLAAGVLFQIVSDSQMAVLNGLRRVGDLARINIVGSALGTVAAVLLVLAMGQRAVAYATVVPVLSVLACSWWLVRRVPLSRKRPEWNELKANLAGLLRLGMAFMLSGLMMTGALLFTRIIFVNRLGLAATGLFQAAWGIAVTNIDFVLGAMGIDFYPHLTACVKQDRSLGNRLVNEQTEIALLVGGPLILGMLTCSGLLIHVFFSGRFALATDLLRWLVLGSVLKIVSWPMGFLILAHGWARITLFVEFVWCSVYVVLIYFGCQRFGVDCAGYAFLGAYLSYGVVLYALVRLRGGFRWTMANIKIASAVLFLAIVVLMSFWRNQVAGYVAGSSFTVALSILAFKRLYVMVNKPAPSSLLSAVRQKIRPSAIALPRPT